MYIYIYMARLMPSGGIDVLLGASDVLLHVPFVFNPFATSISLWTVKKLTHTHHQ